jgi:hypothetical protein
MLYTIISGGVDSLSGEITIHRSYAFRASKDKWKSYVNNFQQGEDFISVMEYEDNYSPVISLTEFADMNIYHCCSDYPIIGGVIRGTDSDKLKQLKFHVYGKNNNKIKTVTYDKFTTIPIQTCKNIKTSTPVTFPLYTIVPDINATPLRGGFLFIDNGLERIPKKIGSVEINSSQCSITKVDQRIPDFCDSPECKISSDFPKNT